MTRVLGIKMSWYPQTCLPCLSLLFQSFNRNWNSTEKEDKEGRQTVSSRAAGEQIIISAWQESGS